MRQSRTIGWAALAIALLGFPLVFSGAYYEQLAALVILSAISASAWNLIGGYAGQVSVGHAVFFGAGAYMPLLFYKLWDASPLLGFPAGIVVSVAIAVLIHILVSDWDFLGSAIGLMGPATPRGWWDLVWRSSLPYYYIFLVVLA